MDKDNKYKKEINFSLQILQSALKKAAKDLSEHYDFDKIKIEININKQMGEPKCRITPFEDF